MVTYDHVITYFRLLVLINSSMKYTVMKIITLPFVLCCVICTYAEDGLNECLASDSVKWSKIKQKCVPCPDCPPGYFRNLTEMYTGREGIHGVEQCLPCKPCPTGSYSTTGRGKCIKCRMNCTEFYREYDSICSSVHDAKCGSCLANYMDTYGYTLFPCSPKKNQRNIDPRIGESKQEQNQQEQPVNQQEHAEKDTSHENAKGDILGAMIGYIFGGTAAVILSLLVATFLVKRRKTRQRNGVYHLSGDVDLEMDAAHSNGDATVPKTKFPSQMPDVVRPELEMHMQPLVRPELSQTITDQPEGLNGIQTLQLSDGSLVSFPRLNKDICRCKKIRNCHCSVDTFPKHILDKSDKYITEAAKEVCHDPFPLFRNLGLEDSTLYQENDTRDRDPEKISQKELVIRLLNRWVEIKGTQATLQVLSKALCKAQFHGINTKLHQLCGTDIAEIYV